MFCICFKLATIVSTVSPARRVSLICSESTGTDTEKARVPDRASQGSLEVEDKEGRYAFETRGKDEEDNMDEEEDDDELE